MILIIIMLILILGLPLSTRLGIITQIAYLGKYLYLLNSPRYLFQLSVNLGGWFVLEPFITPAFYQKYVGAVDEWTLSLLMAADTASGGMSQLEEHYKTFIV